MYIYIVIRSFGRAVESHRAADKNIVMKFGGVPHLAWRRAPNAPRRRRDGPLDGLLDGCRERVGSRGHAQMSRIKELLEKPSKKKKKKVY